MTKKITDSRLARLWSQAVVAKYGRCPITGMTDDLQAHHIIPKGRQNRFALRWDIRNGVPLHPTAHRALHDGDLTVIKKVMDYVADRGDMDYLMGLKYKLKDEYLKELGVSEDEFKEDICAELKCAIAGSCGM